MRTEDKDNDTRYLLLFIDKQGSLYEIDDFDSLDRTIEEGKSYGKSGNGRFVAVPAIEINID